MRIAKDLAVAPGAPRADYAEDPMAVMPVNPGWLMSGIAVGAFDVFPMECCARDWCDW